ncbi:MAG TPA: hypothetical protein VFV38_15735 [Ktedonobacteraceae bacterium]|nr:hypothetical protein [Ktedonobacteraceae bacterium]
MFFSQDALIALEQWIESFADYESIEAWRSALSPTWTMMISLQILLEKLATSCL